MRRAPRTGRRDVSEVSPENAPAGMTVRPLLETSLGDSKKKTSKRAHRTWDKQLCDGAPACCYGTEASWEGADCCDVLPVVVGTATRPIGAVLVRAAQLLQGRLQRSTVIRRRASQDRGEGQEGGDEKRKSHFLFWGRKMCSGREEEEEEEEEEIRKEESKTNLKQSLTPS